ncbi:N-acetylmuramoyl-L-alanine amidase [Halomonas sp. McH1-25]|uniref:N-acetylmuramoyl-L-alanine amidase n=1 Tax=unclassified Halomonas TaxID=2609666 RepID=UPI001EF5844B|nr:MULTISPECIES: N-acetylmuramoyl-L-alanine amidase [unclassified Halomonas]MCG7602193.1 N-acetylmuramoyl-L-alanine amidase [Halomonas sp. McH1-25]MCP1344670.1 N-acetylmuramoyl-L-alanine amidase [Halomonas sp. FL8]MCP1362471.1 N-acetylmuramoyl-L-alanine amidase [Halomonas sp. BBD45]MCP1366110.1 N-acetylmuramoyl-L-alanine amidase [Halomonas sp. BBD48]
MRLRPIIIALLALATFSSATHAAGIAQARAWTDAGKTRLVLELTGPVTPTLFELSNPRRLVVDLPGATAVQGLTDRLDLSRSPITAVRSGEHRDMTRLVLDLNGPVRHKHFLLAPHQGQPDRLVIDLSFSDPGNAGNTTKAASLLPSAPAATGRDIIVVVDAGHGGKDPGAIGAKGTYEKDIVLAIAKRVDRLLDETPGFEGELTRKDDTFLSLRDRTRLARDLSADFFVSVHADAAKRHSAQGSSIYALSTSGASSETARWLTRQESSLLGGEDEHIALAEADPMLRSVLLDLAMGVTLNDSISAGDRMLAAVGKVNRLHKPRVEQAGFVVLKSPDIPSLLVETGFITNADEERRLKDPAHQAKLAEAIRDGLIAHFDRHAPAGTWLAQQARAGGLPVVAPATVAAAAKAPARYEIQQGDTLATISEALGIPLEILQAKNPVESLPLQAGATLSLPGTATPGT